MMTRWRWVLLQLSRQLWVRATLLGMLGVFAAMLAAVGEQFIPGKLPGRIGSDAVDDLLGIIASSMLAVSTFSLSIMTSAYGSATTNVTPRAARLLVQDRLTQNVLSTFIGSFLFSIVGIVALKAGAYGSRGRVILFVLTVAVIMLIVVSLLRWIDHLTRLGHVGETTDRVEQAACDAIEARRKNPCLGGLPRQDDNHEVPSGAIAVTTATVGYVQYIDIAAVSECCVRINTDIVIDVIPGSFVYPHTTLAWFTPTREAAATDQDEACAAIRDAFSIDNERSYDQDPRFGLAVLSEIASRALSPAVNDPGTAIDVIGRNVRLLSRFAQPRPVGQDEIPHPRVHVPVLHTHDLFDDAFLALARDGAGMVEVQLRLQKALLALSKLEDDDFRAAARHHSRLALARAESAMALDEDRDRIREIARHVAG